MIYRVLSGDPLLAAGANAGPVLGLDTGGPVAHLGLVVDGRLAATASRPVASHGADLPVAVDEMLASSGLRMRDLAAIAVGIGPGSFTGLRVGLSYAKGVIVGTGMHIVGIPSLDAMALCAVADPRARPGVRISPVIDARRGEVYISLYELGNDALEKVVDDQAVSLDEFAPGITGEVLFVGTAKAEEARTLALRSGAAAGVVAEGLHPGGFIAALGAARVAGGAADDAGALQPLYVRPPGASVKSTTIDPGERSHGTPRGRVDPAARAS